MIGDRHSLLELVEINEGNGCIGAISPEPASDLATADRRANDSLARQRKGNGQSGRFANSWGWRRCHGFLGDVFGSIFAAGKVNEFAPS